MEVEYTQEDKLLIFKITEELDHHTTEKIRRKADYDIERSIPRKVIFDFDNVTFMDSAGIGLILGRYKNISMLGGTLEVINTSDKVSKILNMSGMERIIKINRKESA